MSREDENDDKCTDTHHSEYRDFGHSCISGKKQNNAKQNKIFSEIPASGRQPHESKKNDFYIPRVMILKYSYENLP